MRASGAADPFDAVSIGHSDAVQVCVVGCGIPCSMLIDQLPLHMKCFLDQLRTPAPAETQRADVPAEDTVASAQEPDAADPRPGSTRRPAHTPSPRAGAAHVSPSRPAVREGPGAARAGAPALRTLGVLDTTGLWLDADTVVQAPAPADIDELYQLALTHSLRQLWVHPSLHASLGIPASREVSLSPAEALTHPFTDTAAVSCDPGGLAAWVNVRAARTGRAVGTGGGGRRVAVVFPAYESRCGWRTTTTGRDLVAAVEQFNTALGENYYWSPNETGVALINNTASTDPRALSGDDLPPPAGQIVHSGLWTRHLLDHEDDDEAWVHRYDLNGAEPAVFGIVPIATAAYRHHIAPEFERRRDANRAGYWLINLPRDPHGQVPGLDSRLPDLLLRPFREADRRSDTPGGPAWFYTDSLVLLDELEVPFEVHEAWIAQDSGRVLRKTNDHYRAARAQLQAGDDAGLPGAATALGVLKTVFTSRIGDFGRAEARIMRPDIRDAIKARAAANQYRGLRGAALGKPATKTRPAVPASGQFPMAVYADAVYYVSTQPDAWAAAQQIGLPITTRGADPVRGQYSRDLGYYKHEASLPLSVVREFVGTRNFHVAFTRIGEGKDPTPRRRRPAGTTGEGNAV